MNGIQTAKEVRESYINSMGEELGAVYFALWREVAHLHMKWKEYLALFGSEKRIALLNQSASGCFKVIQDALWRDIQLHICRLTDPPETPAKGQPKTNLSIRRLPELVRPDLKDDTLALTKRALDEAKDIRERRNLHMAHMDLEYALDEEGVISLPGTNRSNIESCLQSIAAVLDLISQKYRDSQLVFGSVRLRNGAEGLLYVLHYGIVLQNERKERIKAGKSTPEDLIPPTFLGS